MLLRYKATRIVGITDAYNNVITMSSNKLFLAVLALIVKSILQNITQKNHAQLFNSHLFKYVGYTRTPEKYYTVINFYIWSKIITQFYV